MKFLKQNGVYYFAVIGCFVILALGLANIREQVLPVSAPVQGALIIIDPGHGKPDGGAVSVSGALESEINLSVSQKLQAVLTLCGVETVMTRKDENGIYDDTCNTVAQKKVSDIHKRAEIANSMPEGILVSIHQNHFSDGKYHGAQVFSSSNEASILLSQIMQESLRIGLDVNNHRKEKIAEGVYLLDKAENTGILIECGFLSNSTEEQKLRTPAYQKQIAMAICTGLFQYINQSNCLNF